MNLVTSGIVTNQYGHVLLIQRDDSLTWAPPGGGLEYGELPTEGVVREVREETGLIVMAVRLVALDFARSKTNSLLSMTFRCIQRGGKIATSAESPQVGWVKGNELPSSMLSFHRQRVEEALNHRGGPPIWQVEQGGFGDRFHKLRRSFAAIGKRKESASNDTTTTPNWELETAVIIQNNQNEILWVKSGNRWVLPGATSDNNQPPWETAVQATQNQIGTKPTLTTLSAVYTHENKVTLVFSGTITVANQSQVDNTLYSLNPPHDVDQTQASWISNAANAGIITVFR